MKRWEEQVRVEMSGGTEEMEARKPPPKSASRVAQSDSRVSLSAGGYQFSAAERGLRINATKFACG